MGMYDTVHFRCPRCDNIIAEQTKAGDCVLRDIDSDEVPAEIAVTMIGDEVECDNCHKRWTITDCQPKKTVRLSLVPS